MKTFIFNTKTLMYEEYKDRNKNFLGIIGIVVLILCLFLLISSKPATPEIIPYNIKEIPFSEEALRIEINNLNLPFEDIIIAQARLETGNYTSEIFKCSNNLFGMKEAKVRVATQLGVYNNHAFYQDWKQSLIDYSLWYSTYCNEIKTEEQFLNFLGQIYSEDEMYKEKLLKIKNQ